MFLAFFLSLFLESQAQTFPEWAVIDGRKKEIAKLLADSVAGFSKDAVLVRRGSQQLFIGLNGKPLTAPLDSVFIRVVDNEPYAIIRQGTVNKLLNGRLIPLARCFTTVEFVGNAALAKDSSGRYHWESLRQAFKAPSTFDSVNVFPGDVALAKNKGGLYWLHAQYGAIPLQMPRSTGLASIKKAHILQTGKVIHLATLQMGYVQLFNQKGAPVGSSGKAADIRPALVGVLFRNGSEWYYQDPAKTLPVPLKGKVISADPQKIIVNRQGKFFAFWKGGRATWLKLETADSIGLFKAGLASFRFKGKYGFIDSIGYIRIAARYQVATDFADGWSLVKAGGKWGAIDRRENFVVQPFNDTIWYSQGLFAQQSVRGVLLFDPVTQTSSELYDSILCGSAGYITLKSGKQGYLNTKAKTILAPRFEAVQEITPLQTVAYRQNNRWHFSDGQLGRYPSARKLSVCPISGYCFIQTGNLN